MPLECDKCIARIERCHQSAENIINNRRMQLKTNECHQLARKNRQLNLTVTLLTCQLMGRRQTDDVCMIPLIF